MTIRHRISAQTDTEPGDDWRERAACKDSLTPDDWFIDAGYHGRRLTSAALAAAVDAVKAICAACPSRTACLDFAIANDQREGIWGGLTERERAVMHRRKARERQEPKHGTAAGYKQHRRLGEKACESCHQANRRQSQDARLRGIPA